MRTKATDSQVAKKFIKIKQRATSKGFEFDMTLSRVRTLMNTKRCFFTNKIMTNDGNQQTQVSFDRLDNSKGYTNANVVACIESFNLKKSDLSIKEIELLYKGIMKHRK